MGNITSKDLVHALMQLVYDCNTYSIIIVVSPDNNRGNCPPCHHVRRDFLSTPYVRSVFHMPNIYDEIATTKNLVVFAFKIAALVGNYSIQEYFGSEDLLH